MKIKKYDRHPLSAEYGDLTGPIWEAMLKGLEDHGIVGSRKIWLAPDGDEIKVIDGWQLYRACLELGIQPEFKPVPKQIPLDEFVQIMNNHRRHESPDDVVARLASRREKVAELRRQGDSETVIAEKVGASRSAVHRDLEAINLSGGQVEPESGKTTGKDGKSRKAAQKNKAPEIICDRCKRAGKVKGCPRCAEAKKSSRKSAIDELREELENDEPEAEETKEEEIKRINSSLESWCRDLMKFAATLPEDAWLDDLNKKEAVNAKLKAACETVRSAKCSKPCPKCESGCKLCHKTGRVTMYALQQMGAA